MQKQQILSCIQPTGEMHLGNYLGAIQNWVKLQENYDCFYGVVDYHAQTMPYNPAILRENVMDIALNLIACGVKTENLFIQSLIPEHTELTWILSCMTSHGELSRQTQFKDKSLQLEEKGDSFISAGLFFYPVLQAADILIYHPHLVPVGKDQEQHLELSRNIANRFNHTFKVEYFHEPKALFTEIPKVQSLANPTKKMSKSLGEKHYIALFEEEASIRKKVKTSVTDSGDTPAGEMSVGVANLFSLLKVCSADNSLYESLMVDYENGALKYSQLKEGVANAIVGLTNGFKAEKAKLMENKRQIIEEIYDSSAVIRQKAQTTVREVREITGLTLDRAKAIEQFLK
jgi:tryptophanyl-tRNA synthetase